MQNFLKIAPRVSELADPEIWHFPLTLLVVLTTLSHYRVRCDLYLKNCRFKYTCNYDNSIGRRKQQKPEYHHVSHVNFLSYHYNDYLTIHRFLCSTVLLFSVFFQFQFSKSFFSSVIFLVPHSYLLLFSPIIFAFW